MLSQAAESPPMQAATAAVRLSPLCCVAGNGVVVHLPGLFEEAEKNEKKGKSESAHTHPGLGQSPAVQWPSASPTGSCGGGVGVSFPSSADLCRKLGLHSGCEA